MKKENAIEKVRVYPSSRKALKAIAGQYDSTIAEVIACLLENNRTDNPSRRLEISQLANAKRKKNV